MMKERLTEWECSKIANDLDRISDYRGTPVSTESYIGGLDSKEHLSEWDALQIANNIDRINSYRRGGALSDAETFVGLIVGVPMFIIFVILGLGWVF